MQVDTFQEDAAKSAPGAGRAMVALDPAIAHQGCRSSAPFVAQLIACRRNLAAYRKARREKPGKAASCYAEASPSVSITFDKAF